MEQQHINALNSAKYHSVHDYKPGGATSLGPRLGIPPGTLSNKVNPNMHSHQLMLNEAVELQRITGDHRIIETEARILGGVYIRLPDLSSTSDLELLNAYANFHREIGDLATALSESLEDKRITLAELDRIHREGYEAIAAFMELYERVRAISDEPAEHRANAVAVH